MAESKTLRVVAQGRHVPIAADRMLREGDVAEVPDSDRIRRLIADGHLAIGDQPEATTSKTEGERDAE